MNILEINGLPIEITRRRMKTLRITVTREGKVKLSAPFYVAEKEIVAFARGKYEWIQKHLSQARNVNYMQFIDNGHICIFGQKFFVNVAVGRGKNSIKDGVLTLFFRQNPTAEQIETAAAEYCRDLLSRSIADRLPIWEQKIGLKSSGYVIRNMKTRWGTCNTSTAKICFNLQLIKFPEQCLDYIIVHELGHLLNRFHDSRFYRYMDYYYENWREIRKKLNNK